MKHCDRKGMTLIELIVALAIGVILLGAIYKVYTIQHRHYVTQTDISTMQQEARLALLILSRDIRMAGFLCSPDDNLGIGGYSCGITAGNHNDAPDNITIVYAAKGGRITVQQVNGVTVTLSADPEDLVAPDNEGKKYVSFEGVKRAFEVEGHKGETLTLTEAPPAYIADYNAKFYGIRAITYRVEGGVLIRDENTEDDEARPVIGGKDFPIVEDLQFRYLVNGNWVHDPAGMEENIRAVEINLLVRTPKEDPQDRNYRRPPLGDRPGSDVLDGYKRRVFSTVVQLRNVGEAE